MTAATMSRADFELLFEEVKNWGRWGDGDERGSLNHLTGQAAAAAAALVREGSTVSLAHDLDPVAGPDNPRPALHYMSQRGDLGDPEPRVNTDFVGADFHGKSVTHLDALCHCNVGGRLYNGADPQACVTSAGSSFAAVSVMAGGIVGRGVLLDVPRHRRGDWLEPGTGVSERELEQVAAGAGVDLRAGDLVWVRTGARARRAALGPWDPSDFSAGLYPTALRWLHDRRVAVLGGDGDSDARPSPVPGVHSPVHALALAAMGLPLVDNANLEDLAGVCAARNRWEFLCVLAPLRIPGGTGSPVNPIAVF